MVFQFDGFSFIIGCACTLFFVSTVSHLVFPLYGEKNENE